jgi:proteasome lid subunit RPN8/RPN11
MSYKSSVIIVSSEHLEQICHHAETSYPEECCGLLLGKIDKEKTYLMQVQPTENSWNSEKTDFPLEFGKMGSKRNRFTIAPIEILKIQKEARYQNLEIIGIYHSHPDHQAIPSEFDHAIAWEQYSYIIVSVQQGKATDIRSWKLNDKRQFQPEKIDSLCMTTY